MDRKGILLKRILLMLAPSLCQKINGRFSDRLVVPLLKGLEYANLYAWFKRRNLSINEFVICKRNTKRLRVGGRKDAFNRKYGVIKSELCYKRGAPIRAVAVY